MSELPHHHGENHRIENLQKEVSKTEHFQIVANVFRLLADTNRIRIFWLLCHCEECVINISAMLDMTSPAVSHHLKQLRDNNLIISRRDGKEVYYKASDTEQAALLHKAIEGTMEISCPENTEECCIHHHECHSEQGAYQNEQLETIHRLHNYLLENLDKRITIEELSQKFLMNTTTLKTLFKEDYGESIASHIKEHRMKKAAVLLKETDKTIAEIARAVGYESQSKFTAAFKEKYKMLPSEYRSEASD